MKIRRKMLEGEHVCGGCNYECSIVYSFPRYNIKKHGLCAHCFMDMLVDRGFIVTAPKGVQP